MGQAQPLAGWCWVFSVVHAQMGPCSYIELRVWRCRTNRRTHHSDMPRTSGTYRNTWTDGFGCRHTMLAEYHHCQHLKMWNPSKRRRRRGYFKTVFLPFPTPGYLEVFSSVLCTWRTLSFFARVYFEFIFYILALLNILSIFALLIQQSDQGKNYHKLFLGIQNACPAGLNWFCASTHVKIIILWP